ncbi:IS110 family transposase [Nocardia sp. NBC_00508]|uniref:IS110 family transposase n=1 Tax=Nocardia sp. NBC_00508 TaxID=2975992 RepID=UPI002E7FF24E|nr:IS110 family transposase [Nocardia sp. NBC_00508]WUD63749.1 IS110 family transposase [Nocardia sp. NBC_00508]WUD64146.1 IS110 family transposase [Nocardia sp. NBC_00508]WUD64147.1 IS110 family transposase [Nocardia sp. NBC_00508]WUD64247.1 IS110 family transposase [Nocardia sp. NBC_00508]WUD65127.1 IS110 family transposase [Nocardia sp. NBC_00508]
MAFAGWDWGSTTHDVTVIDDAGGKIERFPVPHTEDGIARALARLACYGGPGELPVAIETTRGLVVDRLLTAGHPVIPVHPNAFHAARPRWGAARAKNDPGDGFKLADYARTDGHRLPVLAPTLPQTLELQALTRQRGDHLGMRIAAVNQLAALLDTHWPGGRTIFASLHSPIALAFLDRYPSPQAAAGLTAARLEAFCRRHHYSGRRPGTELLARLREAPTSASRLGEPVIAQLVRAQTGLVRSIQTSIDALDAVIADALAAHPYARLLADLPRVGTLNLAQIIGEVGPILERANSFDQLAAETGIAPVTRSSGKIHTVAFRHATNQRARQALVTWIDNSRRASDWADQRYTAARARGQRHPHAIRTLGRAWLRIIWACWRTKTCYDPTKKQPTQQPIAA